MKENLHGGGVIWAGSSAHQRFSDDTNDSESYTKNPDRPCWEKRKVIRRRSARDYGHSKQSIEAHLQRRKCPKHA